MSGDRRRGRGGTSRNVLAFEALLLGPERHDGPSAAGGSPRRRRRSSGSGGKGGGRPLVLREHGAPAGSQPGGASPSDLGQLLELFGEAFPEEVVQDVLLTCGSPEAATEALLAMAGGAPAGSASGGAAAAPEPEAAGDRAPCYWDWLPEEIKGLVLGLLSVRDLARAAGACTELARHVRAQRRRSRSVSLPEGISMRAVRGAVAAFSHAPALSLSRWAPRLQFPNQFEDLFQAVALGEADRSSGVPIRHVDMSRCGALSDSDVAMLCSTLRHLDSIDLSRCAQVTDDCLAALARYAPEAPANTALGSEDDTSNCSGSEYISAALAGGIADLALADAELAPEGSAAAAAVVTAAAGSGAASPSAAVQRIAAAREAARRVARRDAGPPPAGLLQLRLRETGVTGRGLKALLQGGAPSAKSLQSLDVSGCRGVGPEGFDLGKSMLRTLRAMGCLQLRSVVVQLPPATPLEELDLSGCRQLQEVVLSVAQLRRLSLSHCCVLTTLTLRCKGLEELRCVNCSRLSALGPDFDCPSLRHLDLFGCRLLDSEGLEAGMASFGTLERLNLGGCTALSRLLLPDQAPRLVSVDVSGCGAVRQVVLGSRVLRVFSAKGCTRLVEVRLHTQALGVLDLENCAHLREVVLPSQSASSQAAAQQQRQRDGQESSQPVLRGCAALTPAARKQLRAALQRE